LRLTGWPAASRKSADLKGKARLDIHVSTRHRPHPCGLTLQNQRFFGTQSLRRKELPRLPSKFLPILEKRIQKLFFNS
jgi:hypothetical protein